MAKATNLLVIAEMFPASTLADFETAPFVFGEQPVLVCVVLL